MNKKKQSVSVKYSSAGTMPQFDYVMAKKSSLNDLTKKQTVKDSLLYDALFTLETPDSPEAPDEYKTHITDSWDTLFVGCNFYYQEPTGGFVGIIFLK